MAKWAAAPPDIIGFWRLLMAGLIVLPWAYFQTDFRRQIREQKREIKWIVFTGVFFFLHLWTFFFASQKTLISHTMILFTTSPIFVALGSWYWRKEKPTLRFFISYILALSALGLLLHQSQGESSGQLLGDLAALSSSLFFSAYILLSQRCRFYFSNSTFTALMYIITAGFFAVSVFFQNYSWTHYPRHTWEGIIAQVLFPTLLGHSLIAYLMKHLNVTMMTTGKLAEPVMAAVVASFLFDEKLGSYVVVAFSLTTLALLLLLMPAKKSKASAVEPLN